MTAIVDLIGQVVTAMKPVIDPLGVVMVRGGAISYVPMPPSELQKMYVGMNMKFTFAEGTFYCKVATISSDRFTVDLTGVFAAAPTAGECVLNYHHGHWIEIVNTMKENTHIDEVKYEQFPAICLFQDIGEKHSMESTERNASLNLAIINATERHYTAAERYDNNFDPVLIPLYELFMYQLACTGEIQIMPDEYDYTERVFFGKTGIYGSEKGIFNDYVDAIEINNLKIKTLKFN